jgi:alkylation response protein AidB-like acyl-CoA dehydrogenase
MSTDLSEEQRLMRQSCRDFVDKTIIPFIRGNWQREWVMTPQDRLPPEILQGAEKVGIRTLGVPEEFGGIELDRASEVQTFALIAEEIARGDSGLADKLVQNWKVSVLLRNLAPRHLQEKWFKRLTSDPQFLLAHCLTEPRGASDRWLPYNVPEAAMNTRAVKKNGEWVINGRKQFISNGYDAGLFVVYANTNPQVGMLQGTSSFLVPRETPGLTIARCNETVGCRFMNNGELVFEDMRVPADHLLVEGDALGKAAVYFRPGKIIQAAKNLGVGVRAFEVTSDYVQNYVQGGRILIKHQAVALRLADMATRIEAVRALLARASRAVDDNAPDADTLCNMAKVFASEEILKVAQHALELHGGNGVMLDFGVEKDLPRRRDLSAHGRHRRYLALQDREIDVPAHGGEIRRAGRLIRLRQAEAGEHDREADELLDARSFAKGQEPDQKRERWYKRRIYRGPSSPEQDDGAGKKEGRGGAGKYPLHQCLQQILKKSGGEKIIVGEVQYGQANERQHTGNRRGLHGRQPPQPQQHAKHRKGASGGDEQQIADEPLRAHGAQRLRSNHPKTNQDNRRTGEAARRENFLDDEPRQNEAYDGGTRGLNDAAMAKRHVHVARIAPQCEREPAAQRQRNTTSPAQAAEIGKAAGRHDGKKREAGPDEAMQCQRQRRHADQYAVPRGDKAKGPE